MATKVGGLFISLALDMAQFDEGMDSAADKTKKMEKFQGDLETAVGKSDRSAGRLAERMIQLAGAGSQTTSMLVSMIRSYEHYNDSLRRVYEASGVATTGLIKLQAGFAALQATMRAFLPLLVFEGIIKGLEHLGIDLVNVAGKIAQVGAEIEKLKADNTLLKTLIATAVWRNALKKLRGEELTEQEILSNKEMSLEQKRNEMRLLYLREYRKTVEAKMELDEKERAHQQKLVDDADEAADKKFLKDAQNEMSFRNKMTQTAQDWAKSVVDGWKKATSEASRYASVVQGVGNEEDARWGSLIDSRIRAMGVPTGDPRQAANQFIGNNPVSANLGVGTDEMVNLMRRQLDLLTKVLTGTQEL